MEVLYPRCAGLDVHKDMVVACLRVTSNRSGAGGSAIESPRRMRRFRSNTTVRTMRDRDPSSSP